MKASELLILVSLGSAFFSAQADDITFTNKTATFRNLQGQVYYRVELVRGDLDGLIWRRAASGGRICYTNLDPDLLESFGISSNRIEIARARAEHKAIADARYRAAAFAEAQAKLHAKTVTTNRAPDAPWLIGAGVTEVSGGAYGPGFAYAPGAGFNPWAYYNPGYVYYPYYFWGPGSVPRAPSAPLAPSAPSSPSAPSAPRAPFAYVPPPVAKPVHP
jgi:hypothetical protein